MDILDRLFSNIPPYLFFAVQLIWIEAFFVAEMKKRSYFPVRAISSIALYCVLVLSVVRLTIPGIQYVRVLLTFVVSVFLLWNCIDCTFKSNIFVAMLAYLIQNFAFSVYDVITVVTHLSGFLWVVISLIVYGIVYLSVWFFGIKTIVNRQGEITINNFVLFLMLLLTVIVTFVINVINAAGFVDNHIAMRFYAAICCILIIVLQFTAQQFLNWKKEKEIIEQLLHMESKQHKLTQENIDLINIKCHDLKKQLRLFRENLDNDNQEEYIKEIEKSIMIYDANVSTGNEALDRLLMERILWCSSHGVSFYYVVNAGEMNFMEVTDIYSLFDNILENAFTAADTMTDNSKRSVSLNVSSRNGYIIIHEENYYLDEPEFVDDMPRTTKDDKKFHGFGVRSIRYIVQKYSGNLVMRAEDSMFTVDIIIPIPEN